MNETRRLTVENVSAAIAIIELAHRLELKAWYLPHGGMTAAIDEPLQHRVVVYGEFHQLKAFDAHMAEAA